MRLWPSVTRQSACTLKQLNALLYAGGQMQNIAKMVLSSHLGLRMKTFRQPIDALIKKNKINMILSRQDD